MNDRNVYLSLQMTCEGSKYRELLVAAYERKSCTRFGQVLKVLEVQQLPALVSGSSERPQHRGSPCSQFGLSGIAVVPALYLEILQKKKNL